MNPVQTTIAEGDVRFLLTIEVRLAHEAARSVISTEGRPVEEVDSQWWFDITRGDPEDHQFLADAARYLELQGMLLRRPGAPHIVSPVTWSDAAESIRLELLSKVDVIAAHATMSLDLLMKTVYCAIDIVEFTGIPDAERAAVQRTIAAALETGDTERVMELVDGATAKARAMVRVVFDRLKKHALPIAAEAATELH